MRTSAGCIAYSSDIFAKGKADRKVDAELNAKERSHQARAVAIEASVYDFRAALRREKPLTSTEAVGGRLAGERLGGKLKCEIEDGVMYDSHAASVAAEGNGGAEHGTLYELKVGRASDCCLACIAEPRCQSWSMLVGLRFCQLSSRAVGAGAEGRTPTPSAVSGRVVPSR